ncbi:hypothetical protein [Erwinia sp. 9145]|uniref:nuclear transport factor 2 family protein n=1 Tax=Erwinia sp. 9145 TaxID=1500895 RepID=UPI000558E460|nr:hypothetical protein [Erwinia sp. 9145]
MNGSKEIITAMLQDIICHPVHDEQLIARYFDPAYQQCVDGKWLEYRDFVKHMAVLKTHAKDMAVVVRSVVGEGDTVFTHHYVTVENRQGVNSEFEVLACFTLSSEKIVRCEELTRMIGGSHDDHDLGSRV